MEQSTEMELAHVERTVELEEVLSKRRSLSNEEVYEKNGEPSAADAIHGLKMPLDKVSPRFGTSNTSTPRQPMDANDDNNAESSHENMGQSDAEEEPELEDRRLPNASHFDSPLGRANAEQKAPEIQCPDIAPISVVSTPESTPSRSDLHAFRPERQVSLPEPSTPSRGPTLREAAQEHTRRTNAGMAGKDEILIQRLSVESPLSPTRAEERPSIRSRPSVTFLPGEPPSPRTPSASVPRAVSSGSMDVPPPSKGSVGSASPKDRGCEDEFGDIFYECEDTNSWGGWTCVVSDCRMFYYNEEKNIVQWECPTELYPVLGEWKTVKAGHTGSMFWHNAKANLSLWSDPTKTCDVFEAALKGNVWFLHVHHEFGGNLHCQHPTSQATVLHYAMCGGSAACVHYLLDNLPAEAVDDEDASGNSALTYGVRYGYWNLCKLFADSRCSAETVRKALEVAQEIGSEECIEVLSKFIHRQGSLEKEVAEGDKETDASGTILGRFGRSLASMIRPAVDV